MNSSREFHEFCRGIAEMGLTEVEKAVALLWYEEYHKPGTELTATELAERLHSVALTGRVNVSRLRHKLCKSPYVVQGNTRWSFRISLPRRAELDERYGPLVKRRQVEVTDSIVPLEAVRGTRPYLEKLAYEINGCYDYQFYDACAVLCRRMVEMLLIEAFDRAGHLSAIEKGEHIAGLDDIIKVAQSGRYIKLPRGAGKVLEKAKKIGDAAAHDRYYITTQHDINEFGSDFRKLISQLLGIANITPRS